MRCSLQHRMWLQPSLRTSCTSTRVFFWLGLVGEGCRITCVKATSFCGAVISLRSMEQHVYTAHYSQDIRFDAFGTTKHI